MKDESKNKYSERLKKSLAASAPMMIKPALGSAVFELIEAGEEINRDNLVAHYRTKLKTCPSITGDTDKDLDIVRMSIEHTLAFLGEDIEE